MVEIPLFYDNTKKIRLTKFYVIDLEKSLSRMLNKKELEYLEDHFNKFYDTLVKNSLDHINQDFLSEHREFFEHYFYSGFKNFYYSNETYQECLKSNKPLIDLYIN